MRKLLMATTAVVGISLAGAAQAGSTAPISLNIGGYTDFIAGRYHEAPGTTPTSKRTNGDFETEYKLNIDALGKVSNGVEYGANVSLWNGPEASNLWAGGGSTVELNSAYVWLSGVFGKGIFGDAHGATDLIVYAPTVGEGQIDGRYMDFVSPGTLSRFYASGIDNTEHGTKVTYYTPKVGTEANKLQAGVSFEPQMYNYGSGVDKVIGTTNPSGIIGSSAQSPYKNRVDVGAKYWGNFRPVNVVVSLNSTTASAGATGLTNPAMFANAPTGTGGFMSFTTFGAGTQVSFTQMPGLVLGMGVQNLGHYGAVHGQGKNQDLWTAGAKYEFDKVGVAANFLTGRKYDNLLANGLMSARYTTTNTNYVSSFDSYGVGATYTWFPGLTTAADATFFSQGVSNIQDNNDGYVFLMSQKMTF